MNILEFKKFIENNNLSDETEIMESCMTEEYTKSHLNEFNKTYFYFDGYNITSEIE